MSLDSLLRNQAGVATREQVRDYGVTESTYRAKLAAGTWRSLNSIVIATHNGQLTVEQARWAVVLSAQGLVGLAGLTAMAGFAVRGLETPIVHVLVRRGGRVAPVAGVRHKTHESRRFERSDLLPRLMPTVSLERATIDAAAWSPDVKTALRVAVAPVQQRFSNAARLREALDAAGRIRFGSVLRPFIADLEGGAEALSEVEFLKWCRRHNFPKPTCQVRHDSKGKRRYLDAEFRRADGSTLRAEIDGGVHLDLATRWVDTAKDNDDVIANRRTLRFPSVALYSDDCLAVEQLRAGLEIGQPLASL